MSDDTLITPTTPTVTQLGPDARHVDVAILYGLGMENRAHALAKQLRPKQVELSAEGVLEGDVELTYAGGRSSTSTSGSWWRFWGDTNE